MFVFLFFSLLAKSQETVTTLRTIYQARNIFINNSLIDVKEEKYSINSIKINGEEYKALQKRSSVVAILFEKTNAKIGDSIKIEIFHQTGYYPTVVNPEVFEKLCLFEIVSSKLNDNVLSFTTQYETFDNTYYIEEYRMDKWREIGEIKGEGGNGLHTYNFDVTPYLGVNYYRIFQKDFYNEKIYSEILSFSISKKAVKIISIDSKQIKFSEKTTYSIINASGSEILHDINSIIDISNLADGKYFVCFENNYSPFSKNANKKIKLGEINQFQITDKILYEKRKSDLLKPSHIRK